MGNFGILAGRLRTSREKVRLRKRGNLRGKLEDLGELRGKFRGEKLEEVERFAGSSREKCQGDTQGIFEGPVGKFFRGHVGDILTCVNSTLLLLQTKDYRAS